MRIDPVDPELVGRLVALARDGAGAAAAGPVAVLSHRSDGLVVRSGGVVVKRYPSDVDGAALDARLELARRLPHVLLAPLARTHLDDRPVTLWPAGTPLREDDVADAPWDGFGALLATLHRADVPPGLPPADGPDRLRRALLRLRTGPHGGDLRAGAVEAVVTGLCIDDALSTRTAGPESPADRASSMVRRLTHGDFHLGQLVRVPEGWRLIDVDGLGPGDPAWDLARPAAWFAAGVTPPQLWARFVAGYRAAGGPALPPDGDPWAVLDRPARALVAQIAALAVVNADLDVAETFVACCRRIAATHPVDGVAARQGRCG